MYIPAGGKKNKLVSIPMIFTFVILWHDMEFRLLIWGFGMSLIFLPEILLKLWYNQEKVILPNNTSHLLLVQLSKRLHILALFRSIRWSSWRLFTNSYKSGGLWNWNWSNLYFKAENYRWR
jgi:hypothetical protein